MDINVTTRKVRLSENGNNVSIVSIAAQKGLQSTKRMTMTSLLSTTTYMYVQCYRRHVYRYKLRNVNAKK